MILYDFLPTFSRLGTCGPPEPFAICPPMTHFPCVGRLPDSPVPLPLSSGREPVLKPADDADHAGIGEGRKLRAPRASVGPLIVAACAAVACHGSVAPRPSSQAPALGANVNGVYDWDRTYPFVDAIKSSRSPFGTAVSPPDGLATIGSDGWPTGDFGVVVMTDARSIGGTYKLSFIGRADVRISASAATVENVKYDAASNTTTADVVVAPTADQLILAFDRTNGGIKNVKLIRPGYDPNTTEVFTKPFLEHVKRFGLLRFMDWTNTNDSLVVKWSDRTRPSMAQFTTVGGVPWEYIAQLANQVGADLWVTVPALADDTYVTELAKLLAAYVDPSHAIYVEYSNEVWNFQFKQARQNADKAVAEVTAGGSPLNADGETNQVVWSWRRVAKRLKEISDIFRTVFGEAEFRARVRPVLAGQVAQSVTMRQGLEFIERTYGPPKKFFSAIAGAPYFNIGTADASTTLTADQVLAALSQNVDSWRADSELSKMVTHAYAFGLTPLVYEGGPDTFGPNNIAAKKAASMDPRMKDMCVRYLQEMFALGIPTFNWFVAGASSWDTQYGTWGLTDDMRTQDTPKMQAIKEVLSAPAAALTYGVAVPGEVDARASDAGSPPFRDPYAQYLGAGTALSYVVRTESAGAYKLKVNGSAFAPNALITLHVNGDFVRSLTIPYSSTSPGDVFADSDGVDVNLNKGLNGIRLIVPSNRPYNLNVLRVESAGGGTTSGPAIPLISRVDFPFQTTLVLGGSFSGHFSVSDGLTAPGDLLVSATSDNLALAPQSAIAIARAPQDPGAISLTVKPVARGSVNITLAVTNKAGLQRSMYFSLLIQ
jgi:hypothetical protein